MLARAFINRDIDKIMEESDFDSDKNNVVKCIILCEFHATAGPRVTSQVPDNFVSKELFDTVHRYVIPKVQLQRSFVSVSLAGKKILGYPVKIDNTHYARNAFYFNVCFIFHPTTRTVGYEPVIRKLTEHLLSMELQCKFLSQPDTPEKMTRISKLLTKVRDDINLKKVCMLQDGDSIIPLSVVPHYPETITIYPYDAPVLIDEFYNYVQPQWDLTTLRIIPYVDGFSHVSRIAAVADVALELVQECIKHLVVLGVAIIVPVFQYSNVYRPTPKISQLAKCQVLQKKAVQKCSKTPIKQANVRDIFRMFASMAHGATLGELCVRFNPSACNINEKNTVLFGLMEGLIRRVNKYPITVSKNLFTDSDGDDNNNCNKALNTLDKKYNGSSNRITQNIYTGNKTLDEICCLNGLSCQQMEEHLSRDKHVIVLLR